MKVIVKKADTNKETSTKQFLCGPCSHLGGCS